MDFAPNPTVLLNSIRLSFVALTRSVSTVYKRKVRKNEGSRMALNFLDLTNLLLEWFVLNLLLSSTFQCLESLPPLVVM